MTWYFEGMTGASSRGFVRGLQGSKTYLEKDGGCDGFSTILCNRQVTELIHSLSQSIGQMLTGQAQVYKHIVDVTLEDSLWVKLQSSWLKTRTDRKDCEMCS